MHIYTKSERTANLLGAVSQLAVDRQLASIARSSGLSTTSAAALITIRNAPEERIDFLHKTLERSQPATTRLVVKLEEQGYVERVNASDARAVALVLTAKGERLAQKILSARHTALSECLSYLSETEQSDLDSLLAKILASAVIDEQHAYQICRLCSDEECDVCPIEHALEEQ